jgi:hypothetical protein
VVYPQLTFFLIVYKSCKALKEPLAEIPNLISNNVSVYSRFIPITTGVHISHLTNTLYQKNLTYHGEKAMLLVGFFYIYFYGEAKNFFLVH